MHGAVRSLYKRLLVAAREYPGGSAVGTKKVKEAFMKRADADISDPVVLEQSVRQGEFVLKELDALRRLHKYRALKNRYGGSVYYFNNKRRIVKKLGHGSPGKYAEPSM